MIIGAVAVGALLAGIPLAGMLMLERQSARQTKESLDYYEQLHEQYNYASLFVLTKNVTAGEELTADMIRMQRVQSSEDLAIAQSFTQEDLLGKRCKVSLTKGAAPQFTDEYGNPDYINWLQYSSAEGQVHAARLP